MENPFFKDLKKFSEPMNMGEWANVKDIGEEMGKISGSWNGKDDTFTCGGEIYHEEDAHIADEIVGKCRELMELLEYFKN